MKKNELPEIAARNSPDDARGVYSIAVAAELVGIGEQTLRLYERRGLLTPERTPGGTRRYSHNDLAMLRRVIALLEDGINLAGARRIIELATVNEELNLRITEMLS